MKHVEITFNVDSIKILLKYQFTILFQSDSLGIRIEFDGSIRVNIR